jgi:hypothetical protein
MWEQAIRRLGQDAANKDQADGWKGNKATRILGAGRGISFHKLPGVLTFHLCRERRAGWTRVIITRPEDFIKLPLGLGATNKFFLRHG